MAWHGVAWHGLPFRIELKMPNKIISLLSKSSKPTADLQTMAKIWSHSLEHVPCPRAMVDTRRGVALARRGIAWCGAVWCEVCPSHLVLY